MLAALNVNGNAGRVEPVRRPSKADRQRLVASLVERMRIGTQQELIDALRGVGCVVTQATVSRDIRELGLEKAPDALGTLRYVLPNRERRVDPRETLDSLLGQFGRRAVAAQNLVVLRSEIGSAPRSRGRSTGASIRCSSARSPATTPASRSPPTLRAPSRSRPSSTLRSAEQPFGPRVRFLEL